MKKVYKMVTTAHVLAVRAFSMQRELKLKLSTTAAFQRRRHTS